MALSIHLSVSLHVSIHTYNTMYIDAVACNNMKTGRRPGKPEENMKGGRMERGRKVE